MRPAAFCMLVLMVSCSNRTAIPNDVLPPDSMQVIMRDVVMASEYSGQFVAKDTTQKDKTKANQDLLDRIFQIHHISRESFKHSLLFYESRPDLNQKIFDSLSAYANREQKDLYRPKPIIRPVTKPVVKPVIHPAH
jgi:hypothetical protein